MKNSGTFMKGLKPRKVPCRIHGCPNHWIWSPEEQLAALAEGNAEVPQRMCESCYQIFETLAPMEMPCARPGCTGKWQYGKMAQLQDRMRGRTEPPARFCPECEGEASGIGDREMPCKVPGCSGTWVWTGRNQLVSSAAPEKMCESCYQTWQRLQDVQMPCQAKGCTRTWTWTRMAQLEAWLQKGEDAPPPARMCAECASLLAQAKEQEHPCRIPGCTGTWVEKSSSVFARSKSGASAPHRMCDACAARMEELEDQKLPCRYQRYGCTGTFVWKKESQLRAEKSGHAAGPPRKACPSCEAALSRGKKSAQVHCRVCGAFVMQLSEDDIIQIHLGRRPAPAPVCPSCSASVPS